MIDWCGGRRARHFEREARETEKEAGLEGVLHGFWAIVTFSQCLISLYCRWLDL
jgi:hypothetical protein